MTPVLDWIALYAQDEVGYQNLCVLVSQAHLDRPLELNAHVDFAALEGRTDGLIALTAGREGGLAKLFADAIEQMTERSRESLSDDRSPKNPY